MSAWNGRPQPLRRTSNLSRLRNVASVMWTKLQELPEPVLLAFGLIVLALAMLLSGCAAPSTPATWPSNPSPPQISEPLPQNSYSSKAQQLIESWLERLTGTPRT